MFIITALDSESNRYDVSCHSKLADAEAQLVRMSYLTSAQIEEKESYNPKPDLV